MAVADSTGFRTGVFVTLIAAVAAGLVTLSYEASRTRIAENQRIRLEARLVEVLGTRAFDNDIAASRRAVVAPTLLGPRDLHDVYVATLDGAAVAVVLSAVAANGYNGPIGLLIGIDSSGVVTGVRVTDHRETPGLGDAIETDRSDWIDGFAGASLENPPVGDWRVTRDGGRFDTITGATVTPRAVTEAVKNALIYFRDNRSSLLDPQRTESTIDAE